MGSITLEQLLEAPPKTRALMEYGPAFLKGHDGWWRAPGVAPTLNSAALMRLSVRRIAKPGPADLDDIARAEATSG